MTACVVAEGGLYDVGRPMTTESSVAALVNRMVNIEGKVENCQVVDSSSETGFIPLECISLHIRNLITVQMSKFADFNCKLRKFAY